MKSTSSTIQTPLELGYRMPAEWEPHEATWLSWPNNHDTWTEHIEKVEQTFVQMIRWITEGEKVYLLVDNSAERKRVEKLLRSEQVSMEQVVFITIPTVDVWIRDYGPNFLLDRGVKGKPGLAYNRWHFNAWGNKYADLAKDDLVQDKLVAYLPRQRFSPGIVLEGGSIEVNGEGVCITTEQCLLNPNRNPQLNKSQIENYLKQYLNVQHVLWLKNGVEGDDTDGHIDDIARFVNSKTLMMVSEENPQQSNFKILQENFKVLNDQLKENGLSIEVIKLPMPNPVMFQDSELPASYANFYICNSAILMPIFGCPQDKEALAILDQVSPTRKVVGIDCSIMVRGLGTLHCASQQQPRI